MSIPISGTLYDPYGHVARFADIKFVTLQGSGDVIETSNATFRTDENGTYAMDVQFGRFAVYMRFNGNNGSYNKIQAVTVNSDTIATTLGELLAYTEPLTPDEILIVQTLVNEAIAAKDDAQAAALQAAIDEASAAASAAAAQASATAAANSSALLAPVPLNGGVWASGQQFTAYNQYMIYNGEAYSPLPATSLPYTVGATPNLGFVYQIALNDHSKLANRNAVGAHDAIYRRETTVAEIATGVFSVGDKLTVTDRANAHFDIVSGGTADGYGVLNAGTGKTAMFSGVVPSDVAYGVKIGEFTPTVAWQNRNALQSMLRDYRYNTFNLSASGQYYVLGSIHPLRDSITIIHDAGCSIVGRYNDASIPNSLTSQSGAMLSFVKYSDPDNGVFSISGAVSGVNYILNGDLSTEYNAGHSATHNNNVIGFYNCSDCSVKGVGGVSSSDHRGINFDGLADNCHIDVSYVKGTSNEPLVMKGADSSSSNSVKVGSVSAVPYDGSNSPIVTRCEVGNHTVGIGKFVYNGTVKPQLVGAFECENVSVIAGYVDGCSQLIRQYETKNTELTVGTIKNTQYGVVRAGVAVSRMSTVRVRDIKSVDSVFAAAYRAESNQDTFKHLLISDNNFSGAGTGFAYYNNKLTNGLPENYTLTNNSSPAGYTPIDINMWTSKYSSNLATVGSTSLSFDYKSPDWVYSKLTIIVETGGVRYPIQFDINTGSLSSVSVKYDVSTASVTIGRTGNVFLITCTSCTLQIVTAHN